jgi:very-short-patch-repair endonuclease
VHLDGRAAELATRQHGLLTRAQARTLGATDDAIRHRIESGRWMRVHPRIFAIAGVPASREQSILAAVLAAGSAAYASHATAAELWELPLPRTRKIEVTIPLERRVRLRAIKAHRSGTLAETDVGSLSGIPVTSPARTLFDLSARFEDPLVARALDDALRRRIASLGALHGLVQRLPEIAHGRSPARVHRILAARIPGYDPGDSELETHVWEVIREAGLALPVRRHPVRAGRRHFVVDMAYVERHVAIEVDGFGPHGTRTAFDADRERQNALVLDGWTILRFTSRSTDEEIRETVARALSGHSPGP